jgi:lipopolysaccharide/colanic/teichoic acid biosynthesis glycosyltransferase
MARLPGHALGARRSAARPVLARAPAAAASPAQAYQLSKRALDITLATMLLVACAPLLLVVAVLVRVTSKGPVLFRQTRVGRGGVPFRMLKFRTMRHDCDDAVHREYVQRLLWGEAEPQRGLYKLGDDPRVTRVGRVLRRLSIDELPQLLNVLKGDMALVGPRPALPFEADLFPEWAAPRYTVAPGLTGLWQVCGRNRLTMLQGLRLDVEYAEQRSLVVDLLILLRTVPAVLGNAAR